MIVDSVFYCNGVVCVVCPAAAFVSHGCSLTALGSSPVLLWGAGQTFQKGLSSVAGWLLFFLVF